MNTHSASDKHIGAFGQHMAACPELRALMEKARAELDAGVAEDEVQQRTLRRAQNNTLAGIRILLPGFTRKVLRAPAPLFLRALGEALAKRWAHKKVRDGVARFTEKVGWDEWLAGYLVEWARTGEPGPGCEGLMGSVIDGKLGPKGEQFPVVVLLAGPMSDLESQIEELRRVYQRTMPRASLVSIRDPETQARWYRLHHEGKTDREIAGMEMERPGGVVSWGMHDDERNDELRLLTARVKMARLRWEKHVTELVRSV
jgi:hypothetical protein